MIDRIWEGMRPTFRGMPLPSIGTAHSAIPSNAVIARRAATWQSPEIRHLSKEIVPRDARSRALREQRQVVPFCIRSRR
jgi:hypothetical protein